MNDTAKKTTIEIRLIAQKSVSIPSHNLKLALLEILGSNALNDDCFCAVLFPRTSEEKIMVMGDDAELVQESLLSSYDISKERNVRVKSNQSILVISVCRGKEMEFARKALQRLGKKLNLPRGSYRIEVYRKWEANMVSELKGKTLQVYWFFLRHGEGATIGVRETQRELGLSSPSVAYDHIGKLMDFGLVADIGGGTYVLKEVVHVGLLKWFAQIGGLVVPYYVFYTVLLSTMTLLYCYLFSYAVFDPELQPIFFTGSAISLVASALFCFETRRMWREKLF